MARALGQALAEAGWPVVSGLAEGIDAKQQADLVVLGGVGASIMHAHELVRLGDNCARASIVRTRLCCLAQSCFGWLRFRGYSVAGRPVHGGRAPPGWVWFPFAFFNQYQKIPCQPVEPGSCPCSALV